MFFNARWLDPYLNRWTQPDTIIPEISNPLDWDRYSYVRNNPLKYTDPSGHCPLCIIAIIGAFIFFSQVPSDQDQSDPSNHGDPGVAAVGLSLMVAPILFPAACIDDGNCVNEAEAVQQTTDDLVDAAGKWVQRSEYMSDAAREYQRFISGRADDQVYEIGGYTFDGFDASLGVLKDAKDIPTNFIDAATNEFKPWVSGTNTWLRQAQNQVNAAGGLKIQWFFNSQDAREAMYNLFLKENPDLLDSIELIYKPIE